MAEKKWNYGDAIERFPIGEGETWNVNEGMGIIKQHDLYNPLPEWMLEADMVIVDPPWNLSNVNTFYTKADKRGEHTKKFHDFYEQIFRQIDAIAPQTIFIEMGKQNVENFRQALEERFEHVQVWDITYYKKHPCFFLRASNVAATEFDYNGMDEWDAILKALEIEEYETVADLCMGQGLVGVGAYKNGKRFVGTELNKKRLAVLMEKISKRGGLWEQGEGK